MTPGNPFSVSIGSYFSSIGDQIASFTTDPLSSFVSYDPVTRSFYGFVPVTQPAGIIYIFVRAANPVTGATYSFVIQLNVIINLGPSATPTGPSPSSSVAPRPLPVETLYVGSPFAIDLGKYLQTPTDTVNSITTNPDTPFLDNALNPSTRQIIGVVPAEFPNYPITILVTIVTTTQAGAGVKARQVGFGISFTFQFNIIIVGPIIPPTSQGPVPSITSGNSQSTSVGGDNGGPTNNPSSEGTPTSTGSGGNGDGSSGLFPTSTGSGDDGSQSSGLSPTSTGDGGDNGGQSSTSAPSSTGDGSDDGGDESSTSAPTSTGDGSDGGDQSSTSAPTSTGDGSDGGDQSSTMSPTPTPSGDGGNDDDDGDESSTMSFASTGASSVDGASSTIDGAGASSTDAGSSTSSLAPTYV